jgi:ATP-dependent DNA ligase
MLQRTLPAGFIAPCLPTKTDKLPSGSQWLHEIKHDGFRIIARKKGAQVRLYSRPGNDLTRRFPLIGRDRAVDGGRQEVEPLRPSGGDLLCSSEKLQCHHIAT